MKDLLYKEFRLWWYPGLFFFLLAGLLLLIPTWPFFIAFWYIFIGFSISFAAGKENQDVFFTVSLPVRKRDVIRARVYAVAIIELLQIVAGIPFAIINNLLYLHGNSAGMNTNFAFFGVTFLSYAIFNLIFLPGFYKTAYKVISMLWAIITAVVCGAAINVVIMLIPVLRTNLNGLGATHFASQFSVLIAGIVFFILLTFLAYRMSANRFEKVDL